MNNSTLVNTLYFVMPSFKTGGGNRVFIEIANQLVAENNVVLVYPNNSNPGADNTFSLDKRVKLHPIGNSASDNISKILNIFKTMFYLRKQKKTKIIITDPFMSLLGFLLPQKSSYRFIQADDYRIFDDMSIIKDRRLLDIYKFLTKRSYNYSLPIIFNSKYTYDRYAELISFNKKKEYCLVHPSINHEVFKFVGEKSWGEKKTICLVARRHPWKGFQTFLDVWEALGQEFKDKIHKVILISHDDLSNFNIQDFELVVPTSDHDIARVYQESDIFISTSWWEGFGLPPLEAMACGCAVITSKSGGVDEYAEDEENCLMFDPKNTEQLKKCMEKILFEESLCNKLRYNGVQTAMRFSWRRSADQLVNILER